MQWLSFPSPRSSAPEPVKYVLRSGDVYGTLSTVPWPSGLVGFVCHQMNQMKTMLSHSYHSVICAKIGVVGDMVRTCSQLHKYLYLSITPPLCMQCRRYSLSGIHAAALLKHAVVGWCEQETEVVDVDWAIHRLPFFRVRLVSFCCHRERHTTRISCRIHQLS